MIFTFLFPWKRRISCFEFLLSLIACTRREKKSVASFFLQEKEEKEAEDEALDLYAQWGLLFRSSGFLSSWFRLSYLHLSHRFLSL